MKEEMKVIKEVIAKKEFVWKDEGDLRFCLFADKPTRETEKAISLACGISFAGLQKLEKKGRIREMFVDDECLHIVIKKDVIDSLGIHIDLIGFK